MKQNAYGKTDAANRDSHSNGCTLFCNEVGEKRGKLRAIILEDFVMFSENRAHKPFISATV